MSDKYILIEKYAFRLGIILNFWKEHSFKSSDKRYDSIKDYLERFYDDSIAAEYDSKTQ